MLQELYKIYSTSSSQICSVKLTLLEVYTNEKCKIWRRSVTYSKSQTKGKN